MSETRSAGRPADPANRGFDLRFVNAHYAPDVAATGEFLTDLAEGLVARGHRVHVVTGRSPYGAGGRGLPDEEVRQGVRVTRVRTTHLGRGGTLGRLTDYATFLAGAAAPALSGSPDLTVYLTTPPLLGVLGWAGRRLGTAGPYGLWVMDLHPEAELAHGMLAEDGAVARGLERLDRRLFRGSSLTVALGRCMARRIREKTPAPSRLDVLPLWRDPGEVQPVPREENPMAKPWNVGARFVIMYSGNAGLGHRFDEIRAVMRRWRDDDGILWLFVGGGPRRAELEEFIRRERIGNAVYRDYVPRDQVRWSLPLADVHLLSLQPEWNGIAVPSKLFGIMAAGRPAVMVGPPDAEPARILREADMGTVVDPTGDDPVERLAESLTRIRQEPELRRRQGKRGRAVLEASYSREAGVDRWDDLLRRTLTAPRPGAL